MRPGRRAWIAIGLLTATAALVPFLHRRPVEASWQDLVGQSGAAWNRLEEFEQAFDAGDSVVLLLDGEPSAVREAAVELASELQGWDEVGGVVWPRGSQPAPGTLSEDGSLAAIWVQFLPLRQQGKSVDGLVDRLEAVRPSNGVGVRLVGVMVQEVELARAVDTDRSRIVPAVIAVMVLLAWAMLQSVGAALVLALVLGVTLVWTMTSYNLLFSRMTTVTSLLIPIVLTIAAANALHFAVRFRRERLRESEGAMDRTWRSGGLACLMATITTGMGFLVLYVIAIPDFRRLAIMGALGCAFTAVAVLGLMPGLLPWLDRRKTLARVPLGPLLRVARADLLRRGWVTPAILIAMLLTAAGALRLETSTRGLDMLPLDSTLPEVSAIVDRELCGSSHLEVVWRHPDGFRSEAGLARLRSATAALEDRVDGICQVATAATLVDALRVEAPMLPPMAALGMLEARTPNPLIGKLPRFLDTDGGRARLVVLSPSGSTLDLVERARAIERVLGAEGGEGSHAYATGMPLLVSGAIEQVVEGQGWACLLSILLVSALAALVLRRWRAIIVIWVANVIPLAAMAGLLGWIGTPISVSTAVVGSVVFGLVVDDTLHYLFAHREEGGRYGAAYRALTNLGPAFLAATLLLAAGAAVASFGRTPAVTVFSRLMVAGVLMALLCDLFLAPRVAARRRRRRRG